MVNPAVREEELIEILKQAGAWEFIVNLPGQLRYRVGEGGSDDLLVVEENSDKNAVINAEIGMIINKEFKEFEKNLVFSVNDGIVTLTGSVDTKATLDRLKDRILEVSGVDSVHNSVVMSHSRAESDREVAHRLETTLNKACKGAAISVNVMNHTVVLEGKVLEKSQARLAVALAQRYSYVKHVINNTVVKTLFGPHIPV